MSAPSRQPKADYFMTPGHPARTPVPELPADRGRAVAEMLPQVRPELDIGGAMPCVTRAGHIGGIRRHGPAGWR